MEKGNRGSGEERTTANKKVPFGKPALLGKGEKRSPSFEKKAGDKGIASPLLPLST